MKITQQDIIRAGKHAVLVTAMSLAFTSFAVWVDPTGNPPAANVGAPLSTDASNQWKTGALGAAMTGQAQFNANVAAGVRLMTDGKAAFGPTAIFGDLHTTGAAVTFDALTNADATPHPVCVTQTGQLTLCP